MEVTQIENQVNKENKEQTQVQKETKEQLQPKKDKENSELLIHQPKTSIQDAFKKFQKQKFYQLKLNKYLQNVKVDRTSPQFKKQLRQKFIQTAHKYIGVPYAQRYHQPGQPLYNAPLFIDCCALIRQCVFDLRQEFGYTLGKWNQSYQFSLLPDQGLTQKDMQPGDLIFYSATYRNPKLKPFPFKMVHVEIYLGEGKSIGARWQKGTIQVMDSYKFQSTLYYDVVHHFKSIDSWLEGKFINHYPQQKWLDQRAGDWLSDKYSVFADPSLDQLNIKQTQMVTRQVFVGKGNNSKIVKDYFSQKNGYSIMSEKQQFSPHFFFKWVQSPGQIDFHSFKEGQQIVNHIPNVSIIAQKLELLKTLKELQTQLKERQMDVVPALSTFVPQTFRLDVMSDQIQFINDQSKGIWIYKPRNLNQGRGIRLIGDIEAFKSQFIQSKKFYLGQYALNYMLRHRPEMDPTLESHQKTKYSQLKQDGLIQKYISPLLINNRKFDIRCYLLVTTSPYIAAFHPGYLRFTLHDYTQQDLENQQKLGTHLTNNCFQSKHKDYKTRKEETIKSWEVMVGEIGQEKSEELQRKIKAILLVVVAAAKRKFIAKRGTYELLGCDILVDQNLQPYLLEVNTNPAMFTETTVQKNLLPRLMSNTLDIAFKVFQEGSTDQILNEIKERDFELIYDERSGYVFGSEGEKEINGLRVGQGEALQKKTIN